MPETNFIFETDEKIFLTAGLFVQTKIFLT